MGAWRAGQGRKAGTADGHQDGRTNTSARTSVVASVVGLSPSDDTLRSRSSMACWRRATGGHAAGRRWETQWPSDELWAMGCTSAAGIVVHHRIVRTTRSKRTALLKRDTPKRELKPTVSRCAAGECGNNNVRHAYHDGLLVVSSTSMLQSTGYHHADIQWHTSGSSNRTWRWPGWRDKTVAEAARVATSWCNASLTLHSHATTLSLVGLAHDGYGDRCMLGPYEVRECAVYIYIFPSP